MERRGVTTETSQYTKCDMSNTQKELGNTISCWRVEESLTGEETSGVYSARLGSDWIERDQVLGMDLSTRTRVPNYSSGGIVEE